MIEADAFRRAMAAVPAPVTIVTTRCDDGPHGATVSSFASLSLDPPLVSIALIEGSTLLGPIRQAGRFAVNLLNHRQEDLAIAFASRGGDRFAAASWVWTARLPHIVGAAAFLVCDLHHDVPGGDHALLFGLVDHAITSDAPPLVYTARLFGTHSKLISDRQSTIRDAIAACAS